MDILTVVLGLLGTAVGYLIPEGEEFMTNFAFYCLAGAVAYAVTETVRGRLANQVCFLACASGGARLGGCWAEFSCFETRSRKDRLMRLTTLS